MIVLKWLIGLLAAAYCAAVAGFYLAQGALLFPVPQAWRTSPPSAGFPQAEEHNLTTSDGENVIVWHVPPRDGKPVVLFFHGNGDILAWRVPRFRELTEDGIGLVALSYRGYAGSTGRPSEQGLLRDAEAAYAFAASRYSTHRIVVWGFSLGSGVATALAAEKSVRALILEAPYTSTADVAAGILPMMPVRWLMRDHSGRMTGSPRSRSHSWSCTASVILQSRLRSVAGSFHSRTSRNVSYPSRTAATRISIGLARCRPCGSLSRA